MPLLRSFKSSSVRALICVSLASGLAASANFQILYEFGRAGDGMNPASLPVIDGDGVLYGTTSSGGSVQVCTNGCGTVFALTPPASPGGAWTEQVLWSFGAGVDGKNPMGRLALRADGVLYGSTPYGGTGNCTNGCGTVFALTPPASPGGAWTEQVLYSFSGGTDAATPLAGVSLGANGILYGTTYAGGTANFGTVFSLTPPISPGGPWTETVLHSFKGAPDDGANPTQIVALGSKGVLYGTTVAGGSNTNGGTAFSLIPPAATGGSWAEKVIYRFNGRPGHGGGGISPDTSLVLGNGVLYGTTGTTATIFSLTPPSAPGGSWSDNILIEKLSLGTPMGNLLLDVSTGAIFGTSWQGGQSQACGAGGCGTAWEAVPSTSPGGPWSFHIMHDFSLTDGAYPQEGVSQNNGTLYGTTELGGAYGGGIAFSLSPGAS